MQIGRIAWLILRGLSYFSLVLKLVAKAENRRGPETANLIARGPPIRL